ncbi:alpha/beta fold hydrolase [Flindersiella endophytica]
MPVSRRKFLAVGAGAAVAACAGGVGLVEAQLLPGRTRLHQALGLTGPDGVVPSAKAGPKVTESFVSEARGGKKVSWTAAYPPGSNGTEKLPFVLALHGRGGDHTFAFAGIGLDRYLTQAVTAGASPFVIVSVDGGEASFWHRRADGDDPVTMIRAELMPRLSRRGLLVRRYGLIGWSMGGYGALLYAEREPEEVVAAAVVSPALWREWDEVRPGAFDDESDFLANEVFEGRPILYDVPLRIDCGRDDPFADNTRDFIAGLPAKPAGGFQPGAHTAGYWRRMAPSQLTFLAKQLAGKAA